MNQPTFLFAMFAAVLWGSQFIVATLAMQEIPPATLAFSRTLVGAAGLLILTRLQGNRIKMTQTHAVRLLPLGACLAFGQLTFFIGLSKCGLHPAAVLAVFAPVFFVLLDHWLNQAPLSGKTLLGATLALAGAAALILSDPRFTANKMNPALQGGVLVLLSSLFGALYVLLGKRQMLRFHPLPTLAYSSVFSLPFLFVCSYVEAEKTMQPVWTTGSVVAVCYLGLVAVTAAWHLWYKAVDSLLNFIAPALSVQVALAMILGHSLDTPIHWRSPLLPAAILCILGLWIVLLERPTSGRFCPDALEDYGNSHKLP